MSYDDNLVADIKNKLIQYDYPEIANELDKAIRRGSTGGEIISDIGYILLDIQDNKPELYKLLVVEIQQFLHKYNKYLY